MNGVRGFRGGTQEKPAWALRWWHALVALAAGKPLANPISHAAEPLGNSGLCVLNGNAAQLAAKTVVVIGLARGGTSMVAGALEKLGVHMGETAPPLYEDHTLGRRIESRNFRAARRVVRERDGRHDTWGIKNPARVLWSRRWQKLFREPVYVAVFRDAMAIANRRSVSREKDLFGELSVVLAQYREMVGFLRTCRRPALLVSYEKALIDPAGFATQLAAFLGIHDTRRIADAAGFVRPSPAEYHAVARHRADWNGYLDVVAPDQVVGWAFRTGDSRPAIVQLTVNDRIEFLVAADLPRPDVKHHYRHVTDRCGFAFPLPDTLRLKAGDTVSVRLQGENEDINNSPRVCP